MNSYHSILVLLAVLFFYGVTYFLYKKGKISLMTHRKIWNIVLLVSFLISCFFGVLLAILLDLQISISWYLEFLWIHVELGIIMSVTAIFHAIWHLNYYRSILKIKKKSNEQ